MRVPSLPNLHNRFLANLAYIVRGCAKKGRGALLLMNYLIMSLCTTYKSGLRFGKVGKYNGKIILQDFSTTVRKFQGHLQEPPFHLGVGSLNVSLAGEAQ